MDITVYYHFYYHFLQLLQQVMLLILLNCGAEICTKKLPYVIYVLLLYFYLGTSLKFQAYINDHIP